VQKVTASKKKSSQLLTKKSKCNNKEPVHTKILGSLAELSALDICQAPQMLQLTLFAEYSKQ
jgi:hypothetical protein